MTLTYSELASHLATGNSAPAYLLIGEQEYLRELAGQQILSATLAETAREFNLDRFDGEAAQAEQIVGACNLYPMLGERRVVLVRRAGKLIAGSGWEALVEYLRSPSPSTVLILDVEKTPDARRRAWKDLARYAAVVRCDPLKDREVADWIAGEVRRRKLSLGRVEVQYLAMEFGSDLRRQLNELEKLSLYAAGKNLDREEMAALLGRGKAQNIFRFTDAVADRDTVGALQQLRRLLEEGEPPLPILALLDRTVGQLLAARELGERRASAGETASVLGVPVWKAEMLLRQARRFEIEDLERAVGSLASCDRALKTTAVPPGIALDRLVVSITVRDQSEGIAENRRVSRDR